MCGCWVQVGASAVERVVELCARAHAHADARARGVRAKGGRVKAPLPCVSKKEGVARVRARSYTKDVCVCGGGVLSLKTECVHACWCGGQNSPAAPRQKGPLLCVSVPAILFLKKQAAAHPKDCNVAARVRVARSRVWLRRR